MTPVVKAVYQPIDTRYPIVIVGPEWWEKMSREEAVALVGELLEAINKTDMEWKEAA